MHCFVGIHRYQSIPVYGRYRLMTKNSYAYYNGETYALISNDKKGAFNWEKVAKGKLIAGFACLIALLNVVFFAIVVSYIKWDAIVRTFWGTISNELVWKTIISCEVMILLVIIFFVLRIKAEKKSGGSHV